MTSKFLIALTLLLLGSSVAYAQDTKSTITTASFAKAPVSVLDPSTDTLFANATWFFLFFSAGKSNDTLYVWSVDWDFPSNTSTALVRKSIDASTLAEKDSAVRITASIKSKIGITGQAGIGFVGFAAIRDSGSDTADNLFFDVLAADADASTAPTEVQLTDNSDQKTSYHIANVWWQDDYFYVLYVQFETAKGYEEALYLQAIKGADASLLWKDAAQVVALNNPPSTTYALAGADKASGADSILVAWRNNYTQSLMQTTVSISNGKVEDPTTLVSDADNVMYFPNSIISAAHVYGLIVGKQTMKMEDQDLSDDLKVYYNGTTSKPSDLDLATPSDYVSPVIQAFDNSAGFAVIAQYTGEKDAEYVLRVFEADGTAKGDQKVLANAVGNLNFFTDASGAIWLGYADFSSTDDKISTGYLGKVLA